jgi:hypothetical protein
MMQFGILSSPIQWQICHHFFHGSFTMDCAIKKAGEKYCLKQNENFSGVVLNL